MEMIKAKNITWHTHKVAKAGREKIKGHRSCVLWFTGLPSSGKSTVANELEHALNSRGVHTYVLDGDNIRHGLNKNLGFTKEDRKENVRRVGEVARLFYDAGIVVIVAFISPFAEDREAARRLIQDGRFIEIYTKCPLAVCKERDPKGLYKRALADEIADFMGISHPYEEPVNPDIVIETDRLSAEDAVEAIVGHLMLSGVIGKDIKKDE